MSFQGQIIERLPVVRQEESEFYHFSSLRQGVQWPSNVDVTRREQYLSPTDFFEIFNMSKDEFNLLDRYKRMSLKKEKYLF